MIEKYGRNFKNYFTDTAATLTNNFKRHKQMLFKRSWEELYIKSLCMKVVPKVIKNLTEFRN